MGLPAPRCAAGRALVRVPREQLCCLSHPYTGQSEEGTLGHRNEPDAAGRGTGREEKTGAGEDQLLQGTCHPVSSWTAGSGLMPYL